MNRVRSISNNRKKIKKKKLTKGYFGSKHKLKKTMNEQIMRSLRYSYIGRKLKKRDFRSIWITRINIACREEKINYSKFIRLLKLSQIKLNRKQISEMIIENLDNFKLLLKKVSENYQNII